MYVIGNSGTFWLKFAGKICRDSVVCESRGQQASKESQTET